jgi:hypothetical protein
MRYKNFLPRKKTKVFVCTIFVVLNLSACTIIHKHSISYSKSPQLPFVINDGRARFREIVNGIIEDPDHKVLYDKSSREILHTFYDEPSSNGHQSKLNTFNSGSNVVIVPGIFAECIQNEIELFANAISHLINSHNCNPIILRVEGRSSSIKNAEIIRNKIMSMTFAENEEGQIAIKDNIILIGYSKGVTDILNAVTSYPELSERIKAVVSVAGVVNGTPLADQLFMVYDTLLSRVPYENCQPGDRGALDSLRKTTRSKWLSENIHKLPANIKYYSIPAFAQKSNISNIFLPLYEIASKIDPRNDSQVIYYDAIIPGSTLLGYANADHWAISMPFSTSDDPNMALLAKTLINKNAFPREVLLEAIIRFVEESIAENVKYSEDY